MILQGDCRDRMAGLEENSVDAIVTDPPYELGFMGKKWDGSGIAYDQEVWRQAWRVLKPGGYLLAFGGTRTYHRLACAIEDAGFVLHPMIGWCFGSGFPKATNLSKMLDKAAGAELEVIGFTNPHDPRQSGRNGKTSNSYYGGADGTINRGEPIPITAPATDAARKWDGWYYGRQSLKPSLEPICVAQKPPEDVPSETIHQLTGWDHWHTESPAKGYPKGSKRHTYTALHPGAESFVEIIDEDGNLVSSEVVAPYSPWCVSSMVANVARWGCGAVNIDGCRISSEGYTTGGKNRSVAFGMNGLTEDKQPRCDGSAGRWPSNLILGHSPDCELIGERRVKGDKRGANGGHKQYDYDSVNCFGDAQHKTGDITPAYGDADGMETVADWRCSEGCAVRLISEQSGHSVTRPHRCKTHGRSGTFNASDGEASTLLSDEGTAARFFLQIDPDPLFYCAKASRSERNRGLASLDDRSLVRSNAAKAGSNLKRSETSNGFNTTYEVKNHHPTVKPLKLMRCLVRLVTPPGGVVLDPFAGSGTTLLAAKEEGFQYIGIELEPEYIEIAEARLASVEGEAPQKMGHPYKQLDQEKLKRYPNPPLTLTDFAPVTSTP